MAQYPLDMGRPDKGAGGAPGGGGSGQTLALTVNAEGDINYDAVLQRSKNTQKWLQTTHKALVPKPDELNAEVGCPCPSGAKASFTAGHGLPGWIHAAMPISPLGRSAPRSRRPSCLPTTRHPPHLCAGPGQAR